MIKWENERVNEKPNQTHITVGNINSRDRKTESHTHGIGTQKPETNALFEWAESSTVFGFLVRFSIVNRFRVNKHILPKTTAWTEAINL